MNQPHRSPITLTLPIGEHTTTVAIGHGLLATLGTLFNHDQVHQIVIVSDTNVAEHYAAKVYSDLQQQGFKAHLLTIPAGEDAKSIETLISLYAACQDYAIERSDCVVAIGGGVVGDVAGMLAGTYFRGLRLIQVPTSLVAMVSASVGGKVGINFRSAKNSIGMFKQADTVLMDVDVLATLPADEYRSGLGELVTVGVLGAPSIITALEQGQRDLIPLIAAAIQCKGDLVVADPADLHGIRAKLNLGHTFGHALEALSDFTLPHGIAVAVGLHIATTLAATIGLCDSALPQRIAALLHHLDLPTTLSGFHPDAVLEAMRSDKKRRAGQVRFILPTELGHVELIDEQHIAPSVLRHVIERIVWEGA